MTKADRTKLRLLDAAERLFARQGIEGTSLREISAAAGLSNTSSVQYHFGSKEGLLHGVFRHRMLQMEERRGKMFEAARRKDRLGEMRILLEIICLPHLDLVDDEGRYSYAEFLSQYLLRYRPPVGHLGDAPDTFTPPCLLEVQGRIRTRLTGLPEHVVIRRLIVGVLGFLAVLINHRSFMPGGADKAALSAALADTIDQFAVAIALPFLPGGGPSVP